ncbi:MAG: NAD(P)/FAD-dependent oxidoreductase [Gemmatimonadota bacterium]|nr:MAG: NAD(P)/FAD-dependent oxidoreductase [Gemmatimonadota bacterium]
MPEAGPRIVIVGGGFAGLYSATHLARSELVHRAARITLVDRKNYFTFTPLLAEVAAGTLLREHVTNPYRVMAYRYGFDFVRDDVFGLDLNGQSVIGRRGSYPFDYLILAAGASPTYFGNSGIEKTAFPFTTVDDAVVIRNRVIDSFERALHARTDEERTLETTFVIAGAGPAGVELASEIRHLSRGSLPEYFQGAPPARVVLADSGDRILRAWDAELAEAGREKLCSCGVDVRLNTRIVAASGNSVTLDGPDGQEEIPTKTLVWTAGTAPASWVRSLGLPTARGAVEVNEFLQVKGHPNVFAVGDVNMLMDARAGMPYPRVAPIAISQGVRAAGNIEGLVFGRPLEAYHAHHAGNIVSLGSGMALVDILGVRLSGWMAWWIYRTAYLLKLVGMKNKVRVLLSLALNRVFDPDIASRMEPAGD